MKKIVQTFLLILFLFVFSNSLIWGQVKIKKGFKFGAELLNTLSTNTESFRNPFGYTLGAFTAINIYSSESSAILLRVEANYVRLQYLNQGSKKNYVVDENALNWNGLHFAVFDEKLWFNYIEFGLLPEYSFTLDEKSSLEFFLGPSLGIGDKNFAAKQIDNNVVNTDPYDEFSMGFVVPTSLNIGVSLYYQMVVFELRFRYTKLTGNGNADLTNVYGQIGIAL